MGQYNFLNYGDAVQKGQQITNNRIKNQMAGIELSESKDYIKNREKAKQIRQQFDRMPEAIAELESNGLYDEADKMRNSYVESQFNSVKMIETLRSHIDETNYDAFRENLLQAGAIEPELMPPDYSDDWFASHIKKEKNKLAVQTRKWAAQGVVFSQDFISDDFGDVRWEGEPYEGSSDKTARKGGGSGKEWKMTAADSNSIKAHIAQQFYSSLWDPVTKSVSGLNKDQGQEFAALSEEASRIYNENNGHITHAETVARAARKLGIKVPSLRPDPNDPLGWNK